MWPSQNIQTLTQKDSTFAIRSVMGNFWGYQIGLNRENESNLNKKSYGLTLILALQRASLTRRVVCCVLEGDLMASSAIRTLLFVKEILKFDALKLTACILDTNNFFLATCPSYPGLIEW